MKSFQTVIYLLVLSILLADCATSHENADADPFVRPNILWLVAEDLGPYLPSFGDSTISTPNLSRLAAEGICYPNLYSPSGVCAPSRAAIATGMYPSSIGANHMRTGSYTEVTGLPKYEAIPPPGSRMMSEYLRMQGYYCSNNSKKDYQFSAPPTAWDESSNMAHWRNRNEGQPFFSIFNFGQTHESGLFEPYGFKTGEMRHYHSGDRTFTPESREGGKFSEKETAMHVDKSTKFSVPPYLPDNEITQRDMWKVYNNIAEVDQQIGAILAQLEEDNLLNSTIIFFYGDHGGPMPRQKRLIYDSGLNTPLIVRFPDQKSAGTIDDQLVSFIDLAPTVFSLTSTPIPSNMHGQAFLGEMQATEREYIHAAADRFDGFTDAIRAVRNKRFKYIRNFRPHQGYYLPVVYREQIPTMQELLRMRDQATLNEFQEQWFRTEKPQEELFDCANDPHELTNIIEDEQYQEVLDSMRFEMDEWLSSIGDTPNMPELELIKGMWGDDLVQPVTTNPTLEHTADGIAVSCATKGASIGYKVIRNGLEPKEWSIYQNPLKLQESDSLVIVAHRIGYKQSDIVSN